MFSIQSTLPFFSFQFVSFCLGFCPQKNNFLHFEAKNGIFHFWNLSLFNPNLIRQNRQLAQSVKCHKEIYDGFVRICDDGISSWDNGGLGNYYYSQRDILLAFSRKLAPLQPNHLLHRRTKILSASKSNKI